MSVPIQYAIRGATASAISESVETAVRRGRLAPGASLPTVRALASLLAVSPTTVAAAYRILKSRGLIVGEGRRGTRIASRPPVAGPRAAPVPDGLRDVATGNPDPKLLPRLRHPLRALLEAPGRYGQPAVLPALRAEAGRQLAADGIPADALAVVGGAMDGIERVLQAHLRPGDRVAVEDPGYAAVLDLLGALGLVPEPMALDDEGAQPEEVGRALDRGVSAVILTPRAQNPTGAALTPARARRLRTILDAHPDVLLMEDDHAGPVAGVPAVTLCQGRERWAVVRSISKALGPDLRLALLAGDPTTVARVEGRQALGSGWVSHLLQGLVLALWADRETSRLLRRAATTYRERRDALVAALARRGIPAHGRSGFNVWVPVDEEASVIAALAGSGWAVRAGERYRLRSGPAVRITTAALLPTESERLAADFAAAIRPSERTASA
jgi:DNA-binding transcriptional MocR family regulator